MTKTLASTSDSSNPADRHRPDYGAARRSFRRFVGGRTVLFAAIVLVVAGGTFAWWSAGRGYKTAVLRYLFPDDPAYLKKPTVFAVRPGDRDDGIEPDAFIAADVTLPNPGKIIDKATLEGGVQLLRGNAREKVPAIVNTSGGGDAIVIKPLKPLELNALYTFEVLPALKDTGGAPFEHFTSSFTTSAGTVYSDYPVAADKLPQTASAGEWYTGVTFGPDGKLYSSTLAGQVVRFNVAADGTLSSPQMISTILARNGGPRICTGITFDPASTADNLIAYLAHGTFPFDRVPEGTTVRGGGGPHGLGKKVIPDWSGKITRLSGANLENYQDVIVGLPRARHDHTTGQITFGRDGALYFGQASNTAMGEIDHEWGYRPERLLTACVMRVDMKSMERHTLPLNVQTEEGGTYDPFAAGAPLTIFATGTRNCYDLLFHSNGQFYATCNGSARGGNTPPTPAGARSNVRRFDVAAGPYNGPEIPGLQKVGTQNDYLFRLERGGYYGHPNPTRAEFVMNGGNPTAGKDPCEVAEYPVGVKPDRNWRRPAFDFNKNLAPCGMMEYTGTAFAPLKGKILAVRFSGGKDIIALTPDENTGDIREFVTGIDGFTHFHDPVDLCQSPATGFLYVAEHTGKQITLVRPIADGVSRRVVRQDVTPPGVAPSHMPIVSTPVAP
jgi:glucose/arabinose dehydrogenase